MTWYRSLTSLLSPEQEKALQEIIVLANQRKAAFESKIIEQSGGKYCFLSYFFFDNLRIFIQVQILIQVSNFPGYSFPSQTVPTSFNFGGTPLSR